MDTGTGTRTKSRACKTTNNRQGKAKAKERKNDEDKNTSEPSTNNSLPAPLVCQLMPLKNVSEQLVGPLGNELLMFKMSPPLGSYRVAARHGHCYQQNDER